MDPDKQATLYQTNRVSMMIYNTGSWSAGEFIPEEPTGMLLYNTRSWKHSTLYQTNSASKLLYNTGN